MTRRNFLRRSAAAVTISREVMPRRAISDGLPRGPVSREIFARSPGKGTTVSAYAFYAQSSGGAMTSIEAWSSRPDTLDRVFYRHSTDYGHTWSQAEERTIRVKRAEGTWRLVPRPGYADPGTGKCVDLWNQGVLPTDNPAEGMLHWNIFYSIDGVAHQIIQKGPFSATHAFPGVYSGRNCAMLGDLPSVPLTWKDGSILVPVQITLSNAEGKLYNPYNCYSYDAVTILHGRWKGKSLEWSMADPIKGDPARTTRGLFEPTITTLPDGRLMVVMRGSNEKRLDIPGYRWVSFSTDGGWSWTPAAPWTYSSGDPFFSPSSCSQILRHSNGKLYWLGNICRDNPRGNSPRYPFYIGEVDPRTGLLVRESLRVVDDLGPGDNQILTLSNFYAREDRETRGIALHMTRFFSFNDGWVGNAYLYRIDV